MRLAVEISLYPLQNDYIPAIKSFIDRLNTYADLRVKTSETSTIVVGEYEVVMHILAQEMRQTHDEVGQAIFVCKYLNADQANIDLS